MKRFDITRGSSLKVLERLVKKAETNQTTCNSVLITHVMPTAEAYIRLVNRIYPVSLVIAIPYSADATTIAALEESGISVYLPSSVDEAFLQAGPRVEEILKRDTTPLLVQEVGGYLAGYANQLATHSHFKGIVEDTNNGHWRYAEAGEQVTPVVSMAQSPIKDIEDTVIGDSVIYSTERIFREEFCSVLQGVTAGVIGYGKIGTSTAIALRGREASLAIYDIDPTKCIRARFEGHRISTLKQVLERSDLIVGCTGKTSVCEEDIEHIRDNAVLVSGSAKNEEFDLQAFDRQCTKEEISPVVWKYTQRDERCFYLLNQGTPVNFRDRSVLGFILDMIYSELFLCMKLIDEEDVANGLQHSPTSIHTEVAKEWLLVYEEDFAEQTDDKVWSYPTSLLHGMTHTFRLQTQGCTHTFTHKFF